VPGAVSYFSLTQVETLIIHIWEVNKTGKTQKLIDIAELIVGFVVIFRAIIFGADYSVNDLQTWNFHGRDPLRLRAVHNAPGYINSRLWAGY
jgi:hypothetical protein